MNRSSFLSVCLAMLISLAWETSRCEAQYRGIGGRKGQYLKLMQKDQKAQAKQAEAQKEAADKQAAAIAAENKRKFEMHQKASKDRNEKLEAERAALRERLAKEHKAADEKPADKNAADKKSTDQTAKASKPKP